MDFLRWDIKILKIDREKLCGEFFFLQ
ncbi:unknown protein [Parachlamydia acanthamoebae UV-7]|uniref:Uncharacterized protein n=1 Tax=Parachlamydia acanthamoebae (strain UV7) TaxID=765952 RepID=F8KUZ8_PARAV|nr:unknown protein [Parachlamydia acanthamoebae UV-7]